MNVAINDIAEILLGTSQQPSKNGNIPFLLLSHFDDEGTRKPEEPVSFVEKERVPTRRLLRDGDVLLAAKGGRNFAALYDSSFGTAVASSAFLVVRITVQTVLPEYIAVYLNLRRNELAAMAGGTSMPSISKAVLSEFSVPLPSVQRQREIVDINTVWQREKALMQQLIHEKTLLYKLLLLHSAEYSL